jgi:adenylate cyclase
MTAQEIKRKLSVIFGAATLGRLKKGIFKYWRKTPTVLKALATLVIALNAAWQLYTRVLSPPVEVGPEKTSTSRKIEVASKEKMAFPLPDKPSMAVLPFVNMSEDPKQEFLCDGMTEAFITALSKVPRLFVIARSSTFTYKGKPVKVKQVSEELGVLYVLEGSVQRSGDRVRITAQLIDALTGDHIWAERYDRDLKDIFTLQDEITFQILTATRVKLTEGEVSLGYEKYFKGKQGLDCYLKVLEGFKYRELMSIEDNNLAQRIAEEAIAMCPEVPMAYHLMAGVNFNDYWLGSSKSLRECVEKGIEMAQKALTLDDTYADAHATLGALYSLKKEYDKAIAQGERTMALNPNGAYVLVRYASTLVFIGRSEEAIPLFQKAIRLDPYGPGFYYIWLGNALALTGRFEEAVSAYKKVLQRAPNHMGAHLNLAALYSRTGREKEAQAEAAEALRINPRFSLEYYAKMLPFNDQSEKDRIVDDMRRAGLK